jgi:hypothetical protein
VRAHDLAGRHLLAAQAIDELDRAHLAQLWRPSLRSGLRGRGAGGGQW